MNIQSIELVYILSNGKIKLEQKSKKNDLENLPLKNPKYNTIVLFSLID